MTETTSKPPGIIGIVGLGNMGLAIAERLSASFDVLGCDLSPERQAEASKAGIKVADIDSITTSCSTVLLSLPHPSASMAVATAIAAKPGVVTRVIETSTVTPKDIVRIKGILGSADVALIEGAILAGVAQMRAGSAGLIIAGDGAHVEEIQPFFDALTPKQTVLTVPGTAMAAKVINNAVAHVVMVLLSESVAMAEATGLDPQLIVDLLSSPDGGLMRPLVHRVGERVFEGNYEGGMSLEAARKDSVLAQQLAQDEGVPVFTIPAAHTVYELAMAQGWNREDYAALAKLWEKWQHTSFVRLKDDGDVN